MSSKKQSFSTVNRDSRASGLQIRSNASDLRMWSQQLMGDELLERKAEILGEK